MENWMHQTSVEEIVYSGCFSRKGFNMGYYMLSNTAKPKGAGSLLVLQAWHPDTADLVLQESCYLRGWHWKHWAYEDMQQQQLRSRDQKARVRKPPALKFLLGSQETGEHVLCLGAQPWTSTLPLWPCLPAEKRPKGMGKHLYCTSAFQILRKDIYFESKT